MPHETYTNKLTEEQKDLLRSLAIWKRQSFPNGSDYQQQSLPTGDFDGVSISAVYNSGYYCRFAGEPGTVRVVRFDRKSVGPGTDLGVHFCSRDQALAGLVGADLVDAG